MLLQNTERGLYCVAGDFYIDPWRPVDMAVITHGHSDHARPGSRQYLTETTGREILQVRLGADARIETHAYGETFSRNGVKVSLHPAGHILGSAQVRIEHGGEVCVVSGDYKLENDGISQPFELVRCNMFVTESTFGLPIYQWRPQADIFREINDWWRQNQMEKRTSVLFCYSLGKAQRLLTGLDANLGPIFLHGAMERFLPAYRAAGVKLPPTAKADADTVKSAEGKGFILAPGSADNSPWLRKFGDISTAFASGWMQIRGPRRRRSLDRGFVLSDHADWDGLCQTVEATGAETVWVTHGYTNAFARYLREKGIAAEAIETRFAGELDEEADKPEETPAAEVTETATEPS
ncbi:MAG TPA: ligase-associated DNA damage response exonuclease [Verrucomicrobiae bacterium]|jgi:putative mRNA 3-end processing factor|nr:ligase-associated DNA damage response exonuclease [Verrucomicrobiae bacterium]